MPRSPRLRRAFGAAIVVLVLAAAVPVMAGRGEPVVTVAGGEPEPTPTSQDPPTTTSEPPPETTTTAPQPAPEPEPAPDPATPPPEVEVVTPSTEPADGPVGRGVGGDSATAPYDWPHCPSEQPTQDPPDDVVVELTSDRETYAVGQEITFTQTARNEGDDTVDRNSAHDVFVQSDDHVIWHWTYQGIGSDALMRPFEPGEELTASYTWDQRMCDPEASEEQREPVFRDDPLPPGTYTAWAHFSTWRSNTITFEVT